MSTPDVEVTEQVAAVLAEHRPCAMVQTTHESFEYSCGTKISTAAANSLTRFNDIHLATVLAAAEVARTRAAQAEALEAAGEEQERLSTGPRAMGSRAVQFKRLIFANWLRDRAAAYRTNLGGDAE